LWSAGGKVRRHAPDFFVRLADGTSVVVDVRVDDRIAPEDAEAFEATATACESAGWGYRRVGAIDPVLAAKVRWLAGIGIPGALREECRAALLEDLPADVVEQARWWEHHIVEMIAGVPPEAGRRAAPRPAYDPAARTLRQRELVKVSACGAWSIIGAVGARPGGRCRRDQPARQPRPTVRRGDWESDRLGVRDPAVWSAPAARGAARLPRADRATAGMATAIHRRTVAPAPRLMHTEPGRPWGLQELACAAAMS
jgi:hypothetical protein